MAQAPNEYEAERLARIEENKRKMAEIGLLDTKKEMDATRVTQTRRPVQSVKRQRIATPLEMRRSNRCAGKDAPNYSENYVYPVSEYTLRTRLARRTGGYCKRVVDAIVGWNPSKGEASRAAADAAIAAAEELIDSLKNGNKNPAFYKIMSQSQVSGGFWANAPRGVEEYITFDTKTTIQMRVPPETTLPDGSDVDDSETWEVVWLPRKTGAGFSGGWRGFAIDLDLYPSDVCVFEVADAGGKTTGGGGSARDLLVHIFRAFDYESKAVREARKQDAADEAEREAEGGDSLMEEEEEEATNAQLEEEEGEEEVGREGENAAGKRRAQDGAFTAQKKLVVILGKAAQDASLPQLITPDIELLGESSEGGNDNGNVVTGGKRKKVEGRKKIAPPAAAVAVAAKVDQKPAKGAEQVKQPKESKAEGSKAKQTVKKVVEALQDVEEEEEEEPERYYVEKIMGVKYEEDGSPRFLIKWLYYPESDNSWEPAENLDASPRSYRKAPGVVF